MNSIPDFKGMPLDKYLIPELILPVQPGFFNDPFCLSDFLEDQVKNFAAKGFMFQDDFPMPANSDGLLDSTDQQHPGGLEQGAGNHPGRIYGLLDHWLSIKHPKTFFSIPIQIPTQMATGFSTGESGQIPSLIPSQISGELQSLENKFPDLFLSGLRMIRWKRDNGNDKIPMKVLWAASKQGIWNHLTGPNLFRDPCWPIKSGQSEQSHQAVQARVIANNPNIIHSYQDTARKFPGDEYGNPKVPLEFMDYGKVQPLPGIPFWQSLDDPAFLLIYLSRMTRKSLGCLRADISNQSVITLGSQMNFFYQSPSDLPQGILDEICKMVDAGGSVDSKYVRSNLEKAYLIGYAMENGVILGNSCLKHPRQEFIQRINQITDLDLTNFVERGYTSVRPECRSLGVGAKLLEGLTKRAKDRKIFSIISEDNLATQKIALRNNTRKILTYFSEKLDKKMGKK
jgi:GNAT superfamily N-acetyltransferase